MKISIWGLLVVASLSATNPNPPTEAPLLFFEEAVKLAVDLYNEKSGEKWTFELVEAAPESEWDPTSQKPQHFNMKIQARCQSVDTDSEEQCDFQDGRVMEQCSGYYFLQEHPPVAIVGCEKVPEDEDKDEEPQQKWAKQFLLSINTDVVIIVGPVHKSFHRKVESWNLISRFLA